MFEQGRKRGSGSRNKRGTRTTRGRYSRDGSLVASYSNCPFATALLSLRIPSFFFLFNVREKHAGDLSVFFFFKKEKKIILVHSVFPNSSVLETASWNSQGRPVGLCVCVSGPVLAYSSGTVQYSTGWCGGGGSGGGGGEGTYVR